MRFAALMASVFCTPHTPPISGPCVSTVMSRSVFPVALAIAPPNWNPNPAFAVASDGRSKHFRVASTQIKTLSRFSTSDGKFAPPASGANVIVAGSKNVECSDGVMSQG